MSQKYVDLFAEFESGLTPESKFARLIDKFEAQIHELDYKKDWKGWTKEYYINGLLPYFQSFPELRSYFDDTVIFLEENGYFESASGN